MLYRIVHAASENFALAVFWLYVLAFIGGLFLIFVFPPAPLMLVFLGLLMLVPALIGSKILGAIDRAMVRHFIGANVCPHCREVSEGPPATNPTWRCDHCDAVYMQNGAPMLLVDSTAS